VEYFGPGVSSMTVADRATLANMSPEYGATMGFFPIDQRTLEYLRMTGRTDQEVELVEPTAVTEIEPAFSDVESAWAVPPTISPAAAMSA